MMSTEPRRASFRKIFMVGLVCLSIASCSWFQGHGARYVGHQRLLYGQIYLIVLAAGFSMPVLAANAMVLKQLAPQEWELVRDLFIIGMVIDNFNAHPETWTLIALATLSLILHRYYYRGGIDRVRD